MNKNYGKMGFEKKTTQPKLEAWVQPLGGMVLEYNNYVIAVNRDQDASYIAAVYETTTEKNVETELEPSVQYLNLVAEAEKFFDDAGNAVKWGIKAVDALNELTEVKNRDLFEALLAEACRQWCDCIDECPERKDGEGFPGFFYEICNDKYDEYLNEMGRMDKETQMRIAERNRNGLK